MKKFKKVLAVVTALAMVMAPVTAMAADPVTYGGSVEDTGYLEGVLPDDVYAVVLPYAAEGTYDFILDPEQLLTKFNNAYASDATLYFKNKTNTSDIATAVNKGSKPVVLDVEASFSVSGASIDVVTSGAFTADKPSIALSIVAANKGTVSDSALKVSGDALTASGAAIATQVATTTGAAIAFGSNNKANASFLIAGDINNFELKQYTTTDPAIQSGHIYQYEPTSSAVWSTVGFAIQGEANTLADWTEVNEATYTLSLKVVYTLSELTDGQKAQMVPDASGNAVTADATTGLIEFEGTASEDYSEAEEITGGIITNPSATTTFTKTTLATDRLSTGKNVVFRVPSADASKLDGLNVTKIELDGTEYTFSKDSSISSVTNKSGYACDGNAYIISGFDNDSVSEVKVYYGTDVIIVYELN